MSPSDDVPGEALSPLQTLYDAAQGPALPLSRELEALYGGPLALPTPAGEDEHGTARGRPFVYANFVSTLDGAVALDDAGRTGGGEISGYNPHDRMLMGLLRAAADAVMVGAGTMHSDPRHVWTPHHIYPPLAHEYAALRERLGMTAAPLTVVVSGSGRLDLHHPAFHSGTAPVLIVTTDEGERRLRWDAALPAGVSVATVSGSGRISARSVLAAISRFLPAQRILVEGGPHLLGDFLAERCLDELFLTLAPQIAGRTAGHDPLALVEGHRFAPTSPLWATLLGVKRADNHLFLRYGFHSLD